MRRKASRDVGKDDGKFTSTRRSKRHRRTDQRPAGAIMTRSRCHTSGFFFYRLPSEVFDMILDKMSLLDISVFSMVSKEITRYVVNYISTLAWKNKMIIESFHHPTSLEERCIIGHCKDLGLLFKRCTLLLPTQARLEFVFSKFSQIPCFMLAQCLSPDCIGFSRCGVFLQTLIAGWDELECHRVFNFLCDMTNLLQKIEAVISGKPGVRSHQELQLRLFCRKVLLDPWMFLPEWQFWLRQLLKPWPTIGQAHLLFILYGPLLPGGNLGWRDLVERELPFSALSDLARAILLLFGKQEVQDLTISSMQAIVEELIVLPQPWHVENVARLLVLCGSSLCYTILTSRVTNGRLLEISKLLVYIILVCEKDGYQMSWVVQLVQQICKVFGSPPEKYCFIQQLENTFSEVAREIFEISLAGYHLENGEPLQTLYILLDSSARFHTKFLHMLLK